ncbi:hypothetical protein B0H19DRAFT_1260676 [Mycena capillaripes]|nr:hypothetical protein B0H19DRAFT_1260676 [Mycena capillaripes]
MILIATLLTFFFARLAAAAPSGFTKPVDPPATAVTVDPDAFYKNHIIIDPTCSASSTNMEHLKKAVKDAITITLVAQSMQRTDVAFNKYFIPDDLVVKDEDPFRKLTATLPRKHASLLFQLRSHHAPLAKHLHRLKKSPSPTCPCCELHEETVDHYLHFCPAHAAVRRQLRASSRLASFTKSLLTDPNLLPDLFLFIQRTGRFHSVFGDFQPLEKPKDK